MQFLGTAPHNLGQVAEVLLWYAAKVYCTNKSERKYMESTDKLMNTLVNPPSEALPVPESEVFLVFQRPSFVDKYKGRAWAAKKMKSFGLEEPAEEDPQLFFFFRYWGILNSNVVHVYVPAEDGTINIKGKRYSDYAYDKATDVEYSFQFEKYVMEEVYNKGQSEEAFVINAFSAHSEWLVGDESFEEDELKNSSTPTSGTT